MLLTSTASAHLVTAATARACVPGGRPAALRQRLEARLVARVQRAPRLGAQLTELALAVNVASQPMGGGVHRRGVHATFVLLRAWGDAHQAFRLGCFRDIRGGCLVAIEAAVLELTPFTQDYESIDHRLEARISQRQQLRLLERAEAAGGGCGG